MKQIDISMFLFETEKGTQVCFRAWTKKSSQFDFSAQGMVLTTGPGDLYTEWRSDYLKEGDEGPVSNKMIDVAHKALECLREV